MSQTTARWLEIAIGPGLAIVLAIGTYQEMRRPAEQSPPAPAAASRALNQEDEPVPAVTPPPPLLAGAAPPPSRTVSGVMPPEPPLFIPDEGPPEDHERIALKEINPLWPVFMKTWAGIWQPPSDPTFRLEIEPQGGGRLTLRFRDGRMSILPVRVRAVAERRIFLTVIDRAPSDDGPVRSVAWQYILSCKQGPPTLFQVKPSPSGPPTVEPFTALVRVDGKVATDSTTAPPATKASPRPQPTENQRRP